MSTTTEEVKTYPNMNKLEPLLRYSTGSHWESMFPNTIWGRSGLQRMNSCIGFLFGLFYTGNKDMAENLAETLLRSFHFGMNDQKAEIVAVKYEWERPHEQKLIVQDDGTPFGFSFLLLSIASPDTPEEVNTWLCPAGKFESDKQWKYVKCFNGGILFHGLGEVYAVQLNNHAGWSMHT